MSGFQSIDDRRLNELRAQVASLEERSLEQGSTIQRLRQELVAARDVDLDAEARALASGGKTPKPKALAAEKALKNAEHNSAVILRALQIAQGDLGSYLAQHHSRL